MQSKQAYDRRLFGIQPAAALTRQTRVEVRVYLAGVTDDGTERVRFEVKDTGVGVPTNKHKSIFEEFQQADSSLSRQHPGTGLGLAISRRLEHFQQKWEPVLRPKVL